MKNSVWRALSKLTGLWLSAAIGLAGCANTSDPNAVRKATVANYDPYTKTTSVLGETVSESDFPNLLYYRLESAVQSDGKYSISLYVKYWSQSGWYFFNSANDIDGTGLRVLQLDREVERGGNVEERFGIVLSRPYLEAHKVSGLHIRVAGQRGSVVIKVPAEYVVGFLQRFGEIADSTDLKRSEVGHSGSLQAMVKSLGVNMTAVPANQAVALGVPQGKGQFILFVNPGSIAAKSGIRPADVILKFDGQEINTGPDLQAAVKASKDVAVAEIIRAGKLEKISINFGSTP